MKVSILTTLLPLASAQSWYFLNFNSGSGQYLEQKGKMSVPPRPDTSQGQGPYYLWPGLQETSNSGVYQNVLDGRNGWAFGSGWCCSNPSLPWGGSVYPGQGERVSFDNVRLNGTHWQSTIGRSGGSQTVTNTLSIADKYFNSAIFAIEIYNGAWNFGPLNFTDVVLKVSGTDTSFCTATPWNYNGATKYTIGNRRAVVNKDKTVSCYIDSINLLSPA